MRATGSIGRASAIAATLAGALLVAGACERDGAKAESKEEATVKNESSPGASARAEGVKDTKGKIVAPIKKSRDEWRKIVDGRAFNVLFEEGTEPAFTSALNKEKRTGTFICAACNLPLFASASKYDSGTGWPSFFAPIAGHVAFSKDHKLIYERTEYHCARCGGHQGHVFDDGPRPTGQRWCNNGVALKFVPEGEALPELVK
ncbi:MAG: peptide-methionine (R)-S-oxide reductase MsrB [bacterium]